ncbi:MAG TPA: hypothetical protein HPP87_01050 [Planctomycetes bacterium]|nr:hypothetical protein [Planctomycetota bacterium]HIJ69930.1 hypothetical protein [Planctomycetota bacterium]
MKNSGKKKYQFLLLDAGPIIELFKLNIWDEFIDRCDVTVSKIVANEAKYASQELQDIRIDLEPYQDKGLIQILDTDSSLAKSLLNKLPESYADIVHDGEKQTLAILVGSSEDWKVCAADGAVFRVLGFLGKAEQGISLEEVLSEAGLGRALGWQFSKRFREKYTNLGQIDYIQR